jgi:hypothetical protein
MSARRLAAYPLAALILAGAATSAVFTADRPGADLSPLAGSGALVEILQGNRSVLWTSLSGPVLSYRVVGWPESIDGNELGGGLVIERVGQTSGLVDFGSKPKELVFRLGNG